MPRFNPDTGKLELTRRETLFLLGGLSLLTACGSANQAPAASPTIGATTQAAPTVAAIGPQAATPSGEQMGPVDPNIARESEIASRNGFNVTLTLPPHIATQGIPSTPADQRNVIHAIAVVFGNVPEITTFFDKQQRVDVVLVNSYLGDPNSGVIGFTDSEFASTIQGLENRRQNSRLIVIAGQAVSARLAQDHPDSALFTSMQPAENQRGAMINEIFNYLQGSSDITDYLLSLNQAGVFQYKLETTRVIARSVGGSIMVYDRSAGTRIVEFSGAEQFFGDLLQTYVANRLVAVDPSQARFEELLANFASTDRFQPIATQFNKLRQILTAPEGRDLAIQIASAKSQGDIQGLFNAIQPYLTAEEFAALQKYLVNSHL